MPRHTATIQNTGSRVIVAFMQLPDAPHKCLVLQLDTLPEYYRDLVSRLVQSDEGQAATDFAMVLSRHKVEGMQKDLLTLLHQAQQLIALPIDNILMNPMANMSIPLRDVLVGMGRSVSAPNPMDPNQYAQPKKYNQFEENQQADLDKNRAGLAKAKLSQAQMLEADAARYREEAYSMMPSLRPMSAHAAASTETAATTAAPPIPTPADFKAQVGEMADIASTYSSDDQLPMFPENNPNA
jgi:hypothetical protein